MKASRVSFAAVSLLFLLGFAAASARGQSSAEFGLDPVYPVLHPERTKLVPEEKIPAILEQPPGWKYRGGILYKIYETANFTEAIALMVKISYPIQKWDHHPELRNIYGKVYVGFTTYDQGKKVTENDVQVAREVEAAASEFGAGPLPPHADRR